MAEVKNLGEALEWLDKIEDYTMEFTNDDVYGSFSLDMYEINKYVRYAIECLGEKEVEQTMKGEI